MSTWGCGPFDSDSAQDLLDEMIPMSPSRRLAAIEEIATSAIEDAETGRTSVAPEAVIAAAAIVAVSLSHDVRLPGIEEAPDLGQWLPRPLPDDLPKLVTTALDVTLPPGGWWWDSWLDADEKTVMERNIAVIGRVLRAG